MILLWLYIIYTLALSGMPVMRQMIGCMLSSMIIFGLLSLGSRMIARYRAQLEEVPEA